MLSPELANAVVADLAWCFKYQATVQFHLPHNTAGTVTITLPDGSEETGTWRVVVEKLRRHYGR